MGLTWFALVGGTAVNLELTGIANGAIVNADISAQLFETINLILSPLLAKLMSFVIVILLLTYLVTSADSAILVINTVASGCLLYTSPSPRDQRGSRMPSSA